MRKTVKGMAIPIVVLIVAGVALAGGGFVGGVIYANHKKGGLGDSSSPNLSSISDQETVPETDIELTESTTEETIETTEAITTEPLTEPVTNRLNAIEITVSGNTYIYNADSYTLEELTGVLRSIHDLPVFITDDNASLKAYNNLIDNLDEMGIEHNSND